MLASLADAPLDDPGLAYEPKYDGIRAIAEVGGPGRVRLWSRLGNEKTSQFPEAVDALAKWGRRLKRPVVLDGELVALDARGEPTGFQQLQGRIHLTGTPAPSRRFALSRPSSPSRPAIAFVVFDLLRDGSLDLRARPFLERRAALECILGPLARARTGLLRMSEMVRGDGRALYERALAEGWEGLIAKRVDSPYRPGKRTPDWRKLKILHEQEFVVAGWTEPRHTRPCFGALLLGVYDRLPGGGVRSAKSHLRRPVVDRPGRDTARASAPENWGPQRRSVLNMPERDGARASARGGGAPRALIYVGHTGTGFNARELERVMKLLRPLETSACPFTPEPRTNERPHWVRPELVAEIKFTEWTADGKLRHPVYVGLRADKKPEEVTREPDIRLHRSTSLRLQVGPGAGTREAASGSRRSDKPDVQSGSSRTGSLIDQLRAIEDSRREGTLVLPDGDRLSVSNLHKVFWPRQGFTKGDLLRHYVEVAPFILPAVADRPLVMKRYPNGITRPPFYQHRVQDAPRGVRVEQVRGDHQGARPVGGDLKTLLYMAQLAAISQDPWFSRVQSPQVADYTALDLDPAPGVAFQRVLDVARWIRDELGRLGAIGVPKTSGADGLHVCVALPPGTPYDAGRLFCQIVATVVAQQHPKVATVARGVAARGARVYIDCLQNILGKTLATAYSARASEYAGVSTPLTWEEIDESVRREEFTIRATPARLAKVGDLWRLLRTAKPVDLSRVIRYAGGSGSGTLRLPAE